MLSVDLRQPHSEDSQARIPDCESGRLPQRAGRREGHDPPDAGPFHRIEDVLNALGKDRCRIAGRAPQSREDRIVAWNHSLNRRRVEDVASDHAQPFVHDEHPGRIAHEGGDRVARPQGSFREETAGLPRRAEDNDLHEDPAE